MTEPAKVLCISDEFPWPEVNGYRIRLANLLRALAPLGELDLFAVVSDRDLDEVVVPEDEPITRLRVVERRFRTDRWTKLARYASSRYPRRIAWTDWREARAALAAWTRPRYDLVFYSHADVAVSLQGIVSAPQIVDLDNLEASKTRHERHARHRGRLITDRELSTFHRWLRLLTTRSDERRWERLERSLPSQVDLALVCSELDLTRLDASNGVVVPNGYTPARAAPSLLKDVGSPPTLTMVGLLSYAPNADAAQTFADEILPKIRAVRPDVQFRLVGRGDDAVAELHGRPGVVVVGEVPDIAEELARADACVLPIRFGGGTRIKALEAFSNRIPVVSTTVGCEGLEVVSGRHLLVCDEPAAFAQSCLDVLTDPALRRSLTDEAYRLWDSRYRWDVIRPRLTERAQSMLGARAPSEPLA